jgi:hypothetical protein
VNYAILQKTKGIMYHPLLPSSATIWKRSRSLYQQLASVHSLNINIRTDIKRPHLVQKPSTAAGEDVHESDRSVLFTVVSLGSNLTLMF